MDNSFLCRMSTFAALVWIHGAHSWSMKEENSGNEEYLFSKTETSVYLLEKNWMTLYRSRFFWYGLNLSCSVIVCCLRLYFKVMQWSFLKKTRQLKQLFFRKERRTWRSRLTCERPNVLHQVLEKWTERLIYDQVFTYDEITGTCFKDTCTSCWRSYSWDGNKWYVYYTETLIKYL